MNNTNTPCPNCGQIHMTACPSKTETIVYPDISGLQKELDKANKKIDSVIKLMLSQTKGNDANKLSLEVVNMLRPLTSTTKG